MKVPKYRRYTVHVALEVIASSPDHAVERAAEACRALNYAEVPASGHLRGPVGGGDLDHVYEHDSS